MIDSPDRASTQKASFHEMAISEADAYVYVDSVEGPQLDLHSDVLHHLQRVRRIGPDEIVVISDGAGSWRFGHLREGMFVPSSTTYSKAPTDVQLTVGFAPTKGEKPELVIQKLTELGVDRIVIVDTDRSVVRWDESRRQKVCSRFERVIWSAGQQSRRLHLPTLKFSPLEGMLVSGAAISDMGGDTLNSDDHIVLIGPEGGWSDEERRKFHLHDVRKVSVAPGILRAETAAIAVGAAMVQLRGITTGPFEARYK